MNSEVLETESVKFAPFSGKLQLQFKPRQFITKALLAKGAIGTIPILWKPLKDKCLLKDTKAKNIFFP